jgi:hypothetical protein
MSEYFCGPIRGSRILWPRTDAPWRALAHDAENECFVLDIAETRLMNSPGFDKRHWPDMTDAAWVADINTFYGIQPETCAETDRAVQAERSPG